MENKTYPCLVWSQTPKPSLFGLGGEVDTPPLCQKCELPLSHIGVFPLGAEVLQVFYCFVCQPLCIETEKLSLTSKKSIHGASIRGLSPAQHEHLVALFEKAIKQNKEEWQNIDERTSQDKTHQNVEPSSEVVLNKPTIPVHASFSPPSDFFNPSLEGLPNLFLPLSPKAQSLSTTNEPYTYPASKGVYTQGRTKNKAPLCSQCQSHMSLFLHVDSVSHDLISFENMGSLCVYCCRAHPSLFVLKIEE